MQEHWTWFVAGGFTGLALARTLARWWRRLFWVTAAAAFSLGALMLADPARTPGGMLKTAWQAAQAATRTLLPGSNGATWP